MVKGNHIPKDLHFCAGKLILKPELTINPEKAVKHQAEEAIEIPPGFSFKPEKRGSFHATIGSCVNMELQFTYLTEANPGLTYQLQEMQGTIYITRLTSNHKL